MFCPNCGTQNDDNAATCQKCGFNLKGAAAPRFKGTMLMVNQPGAPSAPVIPAATPPAPAAPAVPSPVGVPGASSSARPPAAKSVMKGTMIGVAPPSPGAVAPPPAAFAPPATSPSTPASADPLAGTFVADAGALGALGLQPQAPAQPGYGAPPAAQQGYGAPPQASPDFGAPAQGYGAPPAQPGFGAPPQAAPDFGAPAQGFGAPPQGFGAPPQGFGAPPQGFGAPPQTAPDFGVPPQGFGAPPQTAPDFGAPPQGFGAPPQQPAYGAPPGGPAFGGPQAPPGYGPPPGGFPAAPPGGAYGAPMGGAIQPGGFGAPPAGTGGMGPVGQDRNPVMVLVLGMVCCVYAIYQFFTMIFELNKFLQRPAVNIIMLFIPILGYIEIWKMAGILLEAKQLAGVQNPTVAHPILYLFVGQYFMAGDLNEIWAAARQRGAVQG